jgi:hypothetical protein
MSDEEIDVQASEPVQEEQDQQQEVVQEQQAPKPDASHNWELARQALAQQKAEIEQLKAMLGQKAPQPEPDPFDGLDPEDYLTVEEARKRFEPTISKKAREAAAEMMQQYSLQQQIQVEEQRLRSKHEDYDFVVENFAIPMIRNNPALATQIQQSKNPAETAYMLGRLSDAYGESMNKQQTSGKAEKILKNSQRPVSAAAVGAPLKSQAENFSKRSKAEIWEESQRYAKGA